MNIVGSVLQLAGSLAFLLYGMKLMSNGVQKSAGEKLQRALSFMTGNRFKALLTGVFITMIIQSSGATTVMVVTFVNAGLLTLKQSVGVIFGANIGTTVTGWIVATFGFNSFKISDFAFPIFGIGFFLTLTKRNINKNIGEALMGFGLLFIGLDMLSAALSLEPEQLARFRWVSGMQELGALSTLIGFVIGIIFAAFLHSSSAFGAIIITLASKGIVGWEFSAAMILGSDIGSTIDAVLAALNSSTNAKRAALIHVMFNVAGTALVLIFFRPFLSLVELLTPRSANIAFQISILNTSFKAIATILFLPLTRQIVAISERLVPESEKEKNRFYRLDYVETALGRENVGAHIIRAEKEISDMTEIVTRMFERIQSGIFNRTQSFIDTHMERLMQEEDYADQMQEQLSKYLIHCLRLPINERQANNINVMLQVVDELENMTDDCYSVGLQLKRSIEKQMKFEQEDLDRLTPYIDLSHKFVLFIRENINKRLTEEKLVAANEIEEQIDMFRTNLKKVARKRLESGADVKAELLYIDLVRQIEKFGDRAMSISRALAQTR